MSVHVNLHYFNSCLLGMLQFFVTYSTSVIDILIVSPFGAQTSDIVDISEHTPVLSLCD